MTDSKAATQFHRLKIIQRIPEGRDGFSLAFQVPPQLTELFRFSHGQYLTLRASIDGQEVRRSYSICNGTPSYDVSGELRVGIKRVEEGLFSNYAFDRLQVGQEAEVMPPQGRFTLPLDSTSSRHYAAFFAGSGITPVLSFMETVLEREPNCRFTLVYANRSSADVMFVEAIEGLKNRFMQRVQLFYTFSRQAHEFALFNGRLDQEKITSYLEHLIPTPSIDTALVCGPDSMIEVVTQALQLAGVSPERIISERFGTPNSKQKPRATKAVLDETPCAQLNVVLDGKTQTMRLPYQGIKLLDVALAHGLDLPYACKAGVCCTCRAKVTKGKVAMENNYTLEQWEIDQGFVLTCQCSPLTESVTVSFDER
jgi:ring-1,2-phenylacetyl-CoA epoxidase subunit PaaE